MEFQNPVLPGTHPDPSVCRVGSTFYLAVSSFEYFPGVALYRSDDLVSWEQIGHCFDRESQLDLSETETSNGIYAPTLRHHDGTFYLVTTDVGGQGNVLLTADDPAGEWSEPIQLDAPGFDPDLFFDGDTAYLSYADGPTLAETNVKQATVDLETGEVGEPSELWRGIEGTFAEAPHIYEIDGTYYLITAEGGTHVNHMVVAARSDDPTGPFESCPSNPILSHRGDPMQPIKATGHGDLVSAPNGSWWIIFLGIRQQGGHPGWHQLGRETFLAPVEWVDGWPVVNDDELVTLQMTVDSLPGEGTAPQRAEPARATRATFDGETLDSAFEYRRNPDESAYSLTDRPGSLTLYGRTESLDDHGVTFVGRRQAHFDCQVDTRLKFDPAEGAEAGLTVIADERHHYEIGVTQRDGSTVAVVRLRIGDATETVVETPVEGTEHSLRVDATADEYRLSYHDGDDDSPVAAATASSKYLATEVTGDFTGVYVGPYATTGEDATPPASFDHFTYEPTAEE
ncbi:alpha-N-arabinofuranosidase [Halogranum gelatinilyticum]|uniref:Alpha-N-arabinofuranosidase n=1 Tax=Halogranum gelatinilyticum TaxID=660521 RepID=A0A1G9ZPI6_9EURY|nr:glycoside hydrolase family 43 protein [Halogranum gelatinilyticum]SDN22911.1 alpha-N-arabinofuranosidase [Halogranum gelatinilyticum]